MNWDDYVKTHPYYTKEINEQYKMCEAQLKLASF